MRKKPGRLRAALLPGNSRGYRACVTVPWRVLASPAMKWLSLAAILLGVHACSLPPGLTRLNNGDYKVECSGHLLQCLQPAASACGEHGYNILSAEERR